jgi:hypothetical protein
MKTSILQAVNAIKIIRREMNKKSLDVIGISDCINYDYPLYLITFENLDTFCVSAVNEVEAVDLLVDTIEGTELDEKLLYNDSELLDMDEVEVGNLLVAGNHCRFLKFNILSIKNVMLEEGETNYERTISN